MRILLGLLASGVLLTGCSGSDADPVTTVSQDRVVDLTGSERDALVAAVEELGYACGPALDPRSPYDACTRPGAYPEAVQDTVTMCVTASRP